MSTTRREQRLLKHAAAALERTQVGDCEEATAILEGVVTLAGEYVPAPAHDPDGLAAERGQRPHHDNEGNEIR